MLSTQSMIRSWLLCGKVLKQKWLHPNLVYGWLRFLRINTFSGSTRRILIEYELHSADVCMICVRNKFILFPIGRSYTKQSTTYKFIMIFMWWFAISHFSLRLAHMMTLPVWCAWNMNFDYNKCRTSSISRSMLFWWDRLQCQRNEITFIQWCICCDSDINSFSAAILVYPLHLAYCTNSFCISSFYYLMLFAPRREFPLLRQSFCQLEASSLDLVQAIQYLVPYFVNTSFLEFNLLRMFFVSSFCGEYWLKSIYWSIVAHKSNI